MAGVLHPVGAKTVAEAKRRFAAMLGEFEQFGYPARMFAMTGDFDVEKPLQRERLRALMLARFAVEGLSRVEACSANSAGRYGP